MEKLIYDMAMKIKAYSLSKNKKLCMAHPLGIEMSLLIIMSVLVRTYNCSYNLFTKIIIV